MDSLNLTQYKIDTFKGMKSIYSVIGTLPGVKLGMNATLVQFLHKVGEKDDKNIMMPVVGLKLRLAMVGEEGCAANAAPFGVRAQQDFSLPDDNKINGFLLYPMMVVVGHASTSPKEMLEIFKEEELGEKIEHVLLTAMKEGEWTPTASITSLIDSVVSQIPTDIHVPVDIPVPNKKSGEMTFAPPEKKKKPKSKPKHDDDNDEDEDY